MIREVNAMSTTTMPITGMEWKGQEGPHGTDGHVTRPVVAVMSAGGVRAPTDDTDESDKVVQFDAALRALREQAQALRRELQFSVDEASGRTVIRVTDAASGETIRQIPSEEVLALARRLGGEDGLLISASA